MKDFRSTGLFATSLLLVFCLVSPVKASLILPTTGEFNIIFNDSTGETWSGMFTATDGVIDSFMAEVGDCSIPDACLYDDFSFALPWVGDGLLAGIVGNGLGGILDFQSLTSPLFATLNEFDAIFARAGDFTVSPKAFPVPEPSALGLFAIGLAGLGVMTRRRRRNSAGAQ